MIKTVRLSVSSIPYAGNEFALVNSKMQDTTVEFYYGNGSIMDLLMT